MTINLEHVLEGDWEAVRRNMDILRSLGIDTGGESVGIRHGRATLTWAGAVAASAVFVSHGLGKVPREVICTAVTDLGTSWWAPMIINNSFLSTTFRVAGRTFDGTTPTGTGTVLWIAIG